MSVFAESKPGWRLIKIYNYFGGGLSRASVIRASQDAMRQNLCCKKA